MNPTIETIPAAWSDARDGQFFRVTASLFPQSFCSGASVLLSSYDVEDLPRYDAVDAGATAGRSAEPSAPGEMCVATDVTPRAA